jgi:hypothetical protein
LSLRAGREDILGFDGKVPQAISRKCRRPNGVKTSIRGWHTEPQRIDLVAEFVLKNALRFYSSIKLIYWEI